MHCRFIQQFCEEVYAFAFFKVVQQQTVGKVGNSSMCLWADKSVCNSERIIKIGQYLRQLCSHEKGPVFLTHSVEEELCQWSCQTSIIIQF